MRIKSFSNLPEGAQAFFNSIKDKAIALGMDDIIATKVAWEITKKDYTEPKKMKSVDVQQVYTLSSTKPEIEVLLGYPTVDLDGDYFAPEFWKNVPLCPISGDMEHVHKAKAEGKYIEYPEQWEDWIPMAEKFWVTPENKLMAKVSLPEKHPFTPTFMKEWESGKYGVSIEYQIPEEAVEYEWSENKLVPTIKTGKITGFSFTEKPAILGTKPNTKND